MPSSANNEWTAPIVEWNREKGDGFLQMTCHLHDDATDADEWLPFWPGWSTSEK